MTKLPFELEKALSGGYKIVTRGNREVDYIHDTGLQIEYPIVGHIKGYDCPFAYTKDGLIRQGHEGHCDLFLVEEKRKGWVVYYKDDDYGFLSFRGNNIEERNSVEAAFKSKGIYIKTVEVEY